MPFLLLPFFLPLLTTNRSPLPRVPESDPDLLDRTQKEIEKMGGEVRRRAGRD
jgi:hypothetical protein